MSSAIERLSMRQRWQHCLLAGLLTGAGFSAISAQALDDRQNTQDIRDSVKQLLTRETGGLPGTVQIDVGAIDARLNLASCAALEPFLPPGSRVWGKVNVGVRCNAPTRWSIYVPSTVRVIGTYYVSSRMISQGQVLSSTDINAMQGDLTSMSSGVVTMPEQAVGHTLTMSIGAGLALRQDSLRVQQAVIQGQTIRLVANGTGFRVSTEAVALNSAGEGQMVKVKVSSGQVLSGMARMGGLVEVPN